MNNPIYKLMRHLQEEQVLLCFTGPFSQQLLVTIVDSIKASISLNDNPSEINRIFSTVVELTQNIIEYDPKPIKGIDDLPYPEGIVLVGKNRNGGHYVISVNIIDSLIKDKVVAHLETIKNMDKAELKKLYFQKIREDSSEKEKGGGVGLITIARNAETLESDLLIEGLDYSYLFIKANFK
jgi:hypothetical protein